MKKVMKTTTLSLTVCLLLTVPCWAQLASLDLTDRVSAFQRDKPREVPKEKEKEKPKDNRQEKEKPKDDKKKKPDF